MTEGIRQRTCTTAVCKVALFCDSVDVTLKLRHIIGVFMMVATLTEEYRIGCSTPHVGLDRLHRLCQCFTIEGLTRNRPE